MAVPEFPKFKTEEEFGAFVDTHDTAPYRNDMKAVDASKFRVKRRRQTAVRVPVTQATLRKLRALAVKRKVPLDTLLQEWLTERAKQERTAA